VIDYHFILSEALKSIRRQMSMAIAVTVCVAVSLTLVGATLLLSRQVDELRGYWYDKVEVSVFMCGTASDARACPAGPITDEQRKAVADRLDNLMLVKTTYYESQEEAWDRFLDSHDGDRVLDQVSEDTMPESFRVKLTDPTRFSAIADVVAPMGGVESVQDQRKLLQPFFTVVSGLQSATLAAALAQVAVALLLISNTARSSVNARRREVAAMRLIGSSKAMIRGPFLAEAAIAGLGGAVVGISALAALQHFVINSALATRQGVMSASLTWADLAAVAPVLLVAGIATPVAATAFSLRKHLRL
jgi:cell division transport system permease protein